MEEVTVNTNTQLLLLFWKKWKGCCAARWLALRSVITGHSRRHGKPQNFAPKLRQWGQVLSTVTYLQRKGKPTFNSVAFGEIFRWEVSSGETVKLLG